MWDGLIIVLIVASSICLAIDSPRLAEAAAGGSPSDVQLALWLENLNLCFTLLFTLELAFKVVAHGFVFNGKSSFLNDPWNVLDFFIVMISLLVLLASGYTPVAPATLLTSHAARTSRSARIAPPQLVLHTPAPTSYCAP